MDRFFKINSYSPLKFALYFSIFFMHMNQLKADESKLKITEIRLDQQPIYWPDFSFNGKAAKYTKLNEQGIPENLEFLFGIRKINFKYNKSLNPNLSYYYKLEGLNRNWSKTDTSNWINCTNLKQGRYRLVIREMNNSIKLREVSYSFFNNFNYNLFTSDLFKVVFASIVLYFAIKIK